MNDKLYKVIIFATGALIGSVVTWSITKGYYKKICDEAVESVVQRAKRREEDKNTPSVDVAIAKTDEASQMILDLKDKYNDILSNQGYKKDEIEAEENKNDKKVEKAPYVITPEEFGADDEYDTTSLTFYEEDGILAYSFGKDIPKNEISDLVCPDFEDHFGEFEEDSVYVRNEKYKMDYEILRDEGHYPTDEEFNREE